jgi:hypothetical protein
VDLTAPDQGIAPAPTAEWVERVPTDAAPESLIAEIPAETSAPVDPAPSEWIEPAPVDPAFPVSEVNAAPAETLAYPVSSADPIDPATGARVEPAPVAPIPATPAPGVAPAPVDMGVAGGSEPWGQPIATAYIAGANGGAPCHAAPTWEAAPLTILGEGEAVEVRADTIGEWQPVNCAGVGGYVPVALIAWTPVAPADPVAVGGGLPNGKAVAGGTGIGGEQIANFALQYQGYPYIYAGEGPYAFDCSGFTMFVIQNTLGIEVPHDMTVQYAMGQPVSREALQPGDLVFFANTFRPGMSHNGVYIGGGQFVHAETESSGVTISDLYDDYYSARWYGAVRFS